MNRNKRSRIERDAPSMHTSQHKNIAYLKEDEKNAKAKAKEMWFSDSYVFSHLPLTDKQKKELLSEMGCKNYKVVKNPNPQKVA